MNLPVPLQEMASRSGSPSMKRSMRWFLWAGLGWLGLVSVRGQTSNIDHRIHFDDFGVGEAVERLDPAGVSIPGGAVVESGFPTASPVHFLARKPFADHPPGSDPEPLVLRFDQPQSLVGFSVGDNGGKSRRLTVQAFDSKDATKPIVAFQVTLPAQVGVTTPVRLCRVLEQDIHRIEVTSPDGAVEAIDDLELRRYPLSTRTRVTFDDRPIGTIVRTQYPGVTFLDNPEIRGTELIGVPVRSGSQALHQRVNGEGPARPRDLVGIAPDARAILYRNVYGWFARPATGLYALAPEGEAALAAWLAEAALPG